MPDIRQLSTAVVNKIAAGEVIERPASVVKELVENSVDAGSTRIDVTVAKGGTDLIQVSDNGCGIDADQLTLAVASHATSKLETADDLFNVGTLGFRGEALASIAEVSQFCIRSRTSAETAGAELEINGGQASPVAPCGCPIGTSISVRNLFFNTPVRRKFMRTVQTEMGHISEALTRIALPHPDVHFTLTHNTRQVYDLPAVENWKTRIGALYGRDLAENLIYVSANEGDIRMQGYVADPSQNRANNRMQYMFLNGRHIRDRALGHALGEAYRGLLMTGRYPIVFLRLEMPADMVDVNVHPTKLEVRFQESGKLYSQLLNMVRSHFLSTDLTAKAQLTTGGQRIDPMPTTPSVGAAASTSPSHILGGRSGAPTALNTTGTRGEITRWASDQAFRKFPDEAGTRATAHVDRQSSMDLKFPNTSTDSFRRNPMTDLPLPPSSVADSPADGDSTELADTQPPMPTKSISSEGTPAMQVYNRYLITETDEGVVVIDQHALHERILYEEIREKVLAGDAEVQRLLVPEPVQMTSGEAAAVLENKETLNQLGVEVESFGNDTILVSSYPAMLANMNPAEVLRQVAEKLMTPEKDVDRRDVLDELLHMISCKAAIKAGDRLTSDEIGALLERRHKCQDAHHCPHGRPTTLVFSRDELDRRFKRI